MAVIDDAQILAVDVSAEAKQSFQSVAERAVLPVGNTYAPSASSLVMYGKSLADSQWWFLTNSIASMNWTDDLDTGCASGSLVLDNRLDVIEGKSQRISDILPAGSEVRLFYVPFGLSLNELASVGTGLIEIGRYVCWTVTESSADMANYTIQFYDHMKYLIESKITVLFSMRAKPWSATEMTQRICKQQGIALGSCPKVPADIPYFYADSQPIFDTLVQIWTIVAKKLGRNFRIFYDKGKLQVSMRPKHPKGKVLEIAGRSDGGILISGQRTQSMDGLVTSATFFGNAKSMYQPNGSDARALAASAQFKNRTAIAKYGRIEYEEVVQNVTSKQRLLKSAKDYVTSRSKLTITGSVEIIGMPSVRVGDAVRIDDPDSGLMGLYWFRTMDHAVDGGGNYTCRGDLSTFDYALHIGTTIDDRIPQVVGGGSFGAANNGKLPGDPGTGLPNAYGMPSEIYNTIKAAASYAGVPQSWADSPDLAELLTLESSCNWTAGNPTSGAFGLFQFLDTTWAGTDVQKSWASPGPGRAVPGNTFIGPATANQEGGWKWWQCVAGLRYIKNRYKTPAGAMAHKNATIGQYGNPSGWY